MPTNNFVLDSFALLAFLRNERGRERVAILLTRATREEVQLAMSLINLGEVLYSLIKKGELREHEQLLRGWEKYPVSFREVSRELIFAAARIKSRFPVSYADAFAIALSQQLAWPILTGDPEFHKVEHIVDIEWLPS